MSAAPEFELDEQYNYPVPPRGGWTAEDLDRLPNLPRRTELIDGSLVFMSPQTKFHMRTMRLLENSLLTQAPEDLDVFREFTIRLDKGNRPEPDVLVVPAGADTGPNETWLKPEDVILAIEVVSEDSLTRDREVKPRKYAAAGVQYFWRVEQSDGLPVVYTYELDPATRSYAPTGVHKDTLEVDHPFPIFIDLTAINRRRPPAPGN
ncbi:Uma2 family endonuclease [Streptomyces sp. NPDC046215]|uniref:Uma2 family endonuclease n=1 Tax=Streptomyces stramineus TaxID=173861 RepID=A0ABN1AUV3_9ACTN